MSDDTRITISALLLAFVGLVISAVVTLVLFATGMRDPKDIVAVAGIFTGVTGTLAGAFLGVHIGAAGMITLRREHNKAARLRDMAMARLPGGEKQDLIRIMQE